MSAVLPGFTQTAMSESILGTEDGRAMALGPQAPERVRRTEPG